MFFVFGGALLWWGALGDLMVWGVLAGGGSYVLEGCSSVLGPAVGWDFSFAYSESVAAPLHAEPFHRHFG